MGKNQPAQKGARVKRLCLCPHLTPPRIHITGKLIVKAWI